MEQTWFYFLVLGIIFIGYSLYANRKNNKLLDSDNFIRLVFFVLTLIFGAFVVYARHIGYLAGTKMHITIAVAALCATVLILSNVSFSTRSSAGAYKPLAPQERKFQSYVMIAIIVSFLIVGTLVYFFYKEPIIEIGNRIYQYLNTLSSHKTIK